MAAKYKRVIREISLLSKEKGNYKSDNGDKIDSDQVNDKYPL